MHLLSELVHTCTYVIGGDTRMRMKTAWPDQPDCDLLSAALLSADTMDLLETTNLCGTCMSNAVHLVYMYSRQDHLT